MSTLMYGILVLLIFISLPYWLPVLVINLRMYLFTRINGEAALQVPNEDCDGEAFRKIYSHPAASGRSKGAALSDLFWYWLAPGPEMHQEHIENGERYEIISQFTRSILTIPRQEIENQIQHCYQQCSSLQVKGPWRLMRLRDAMMPFWADYYYKIVFKEECSPEARQLIVDNANNVVTALKCCGLRQMKKRDRLTCFLVNKLNRGELPHKFPEGFTTLEQAFYLQGTFFNTAVVQMSEAMAHLFMCLSHNQIVQNKLSVRGGNRRYLDNVINECLRLYPLFGIAHRILTEDVTVDGAHLEKNSVVCFSYPNYHQLGFNKPQEFNPDRWEQCPIKSSNHIPFGLASNRPCPAQGIAQISMRCLSELLLKDFHFDSSASHSRSLPNRGPCIQMSKKYSQPSSRTRVVLRVWEKFRDQWEDVGRSICQLFFGLIMIIDARRLRLCESYFQLMDQKNQEAVKQKG